MEKISYEAWRSYASVDDKGRDTFTIGYFRYKEDAVKASKGQGFWGSDGGATFTNKEIRIYDSYHEYELDCAERKANKIKKEYNAALAKLTHRERELLGLN